LPLDKSLLRLGDPQCNVDLLLWVFFIASAGPAQDSSRALLMLSLRQLCFTLGIRSRRELDSHIKNILWLDPLCSALSETLWTEVQQISEL
jgi:hypothetical protein